MIENSGIILEGGAMRSVFSAGILDFFLEKGIDIPNVLAVSAGAYAGMNYVSGQRGRVIETNIEPLRKEKYLGFRTFLRTGTFFDMDYLFNKIPNELAPFDFEGFFHSAKKFIMNTINCETGEAVYYDTYRDKEEFLRICRASNSLPLIAKIVEVNGKPMLDGGMADAIPVNKALEEGWKKMVVILTRDAAYRKSTSSLYIKWIHVIYRKYPNFLTAIKTRSARYNEALDKVAQLEKEGRAFVYRPTELKLMNHEADAEKLMQYYRHGYDVAQRRQDELERFLEV